MNNFKMHNEVYNSNQNFGRACRFEKFIFANNCKFQECCYFPGGAKLTDSAIFDKCRFECSTLLQNCEIHRDVEFAKLEAVECKFDQFVSFNVQSSLVECSLELPFRINGDGKLYTYKCLVDGALVRDIWSLDNIILIEYTSGVRLVKLPMFKLTVEDALASDYTSIEEKEKVRKILKFSKET